MTATDSVAAAVYESPFRGTGSYGPEDAIVFFGRDRESDQIVQMVLASRVSYLYAKSGVGKSSLLAARVHAGLEQRGWLPIEIRLGDDPVASACDALRRQALIDPALEAACARELAGKLGNECTIQELALVCSQHLMEHPSDRAMLRKMALEEKGAATLPWLSRVARGGLAAAEYQRAIELLAAHGPGTWEPQANPTLAELALRLDDPMLRAAHSARHAELVAFGDGISELLITLDEGHLPFVLVFDQFEELFTQFGDEGGLLPVSDPLLRKRHWSLRRALIAGLESAFGGVEPAGQGHRVLVSLREDFLAELEELRDVAPLSEQNTFRLALLNNLHALEAIEAPMKRYRMPIEAGCAKQVVDDLTMEQQYVYPAALQVVSQRLWIEARKLAPSVVSLALYRDILGGHVRILSEYFGRLLDLLPVPRQVEAFDLLSPLVTSNFKRNIVSREQLLEAPFRDVHLRAEVLAFLEREHILRIERRLKGDFVEIAHEFLIGSIEQEREARLRDEDRAAQRGIKLLRDRLAMDESGQSTLLESAAFKLIEGVRGRLVWNTAGQQLMLRSALAIRPQDPDEHATRVAYWTRQLGSHAELPLVMLMHWLREARDSKQIMQRAAWLQLSHRLQEIPIEMRRHPVVLRAALRWSEPEHAQQLQDLVKEGLLNEQN